MKTRSNMPLFVVECEDVKALSNAQIDLLRCGDYLVKKDASGEHAYKVTFKSDTGMCITYHDASVIETQSYDKIDGVWTYNSEDKTPNLLEVQNVEDAPAGTIQDALGLDANGDLVKGTISGGTKLYKHELHQSPDNERYFLIGSFDNNLATSGAPTSYNDKVLVLRGLSHNQYDAETVLLFQYFGYAGTTSMTFLVYSNGTITQKSITISSDAVSEL